MTAAPPPLKVGTSPQAFSSSWDQFVDTLEAVGRRQLRHNPSEGFRKHFLPLYNVVFVELRSEDMRVGIEGAVGKALKDEENRLPLGLLMLELQAYTNWQAEATADDALANSKLSVDDHSHAPVEGSETAHAVDAGKTIKDSLESLLGKWMSGGVRKVLGVVNELLSIVRGGS
jgi:hypothetical protein